MKKEYFSKEIDGVKYRAYKLRGSAATRHSMWLFKNIVPAVSDVLKGIQGADKSLLDVEINSESAEVVGDMIKTVGTGNLDLIVNGARKLADTIEIDEWLKVLTNNDPETCSGGLFHGLQVWDDKEVTFRPINFEQDIDMRNQFQLAAWIVWENFTHSEQEKN